MYVYKAPYRFLRFLPPWFCLLMRRYWAWRWAREGAKRYPDKDSKWRVYYTGRYCKTRKWENVWLDSWWVYRDLWHWIRGQRWT